MIREALQWLGDLRTAALEPIKLGDRADKKVFLGRDGRVIEVAMPADRRFHRVNTIDDFAAAVKRWLTPTSVVFHSDTGAVFLVDDADRRDAVSLPLVTTDVWDRVLLLSDQQFDQRSFLKLLRHDLRAAIPPTLIPAIQKIEVVTNANQRSEVQPGRERGTREFAADLASSGEIPEQVTLRVSVYRLAGLDFALPVTCSLDYTLPPGPVTFSLRPLPDQIDGVLLTLQGEFHRLLVAAMNFDEEQAVDVLFGSVSM